MITFNDFIKIYNLKNKATSNKKTKKVLSFIRLDNVGIYQRDGSFVSDIGIVKLHAPKGTHWVCYINEKYFDSFGCVSPKNLSKFMIKRNGFCLYSEYQIQKNDSYYASYCSYILF